MKITFLLALALVGCAPSYAPGPSEPELARDAKPEHYSKLNESPRPMKARALSSVTMYRTKAPEGQYVEVSEIADAGDDEADGLEKLKLSAAGVGCDGLIIGDTRTASDAWNVIGGGRHVASVTISGTCIMFVQDPGTWRPSEIDARCDADREKLFAAKDPDEKLAIARSMPRACHPE